MQEKSENNVIVAKLILHIMLQADARLGIFLQKIIVV